MDEGRIASRTTPFGDSGPGLEHKFRKSTSQAVISTLWLPKKRSLPCGKRGGRASEWQGPDRRVRQASLGETGRPRSEGRAAPSLDDQWGAGEGPLAADPAADDDVHL